MYLIADLRTFIEQFKKQDLAFYCGVGYLIFEYFRPHTIFPWLNIIPWAQTFLLIGLAALLIKKQLHFQFTHLLLVLFTIAIYLSCVTSTFPEISFKSLNVPISWIFTVLVLSNSIRTIQHFKLILILFCLIIFKMSLFGAKTWALRGFAFTSWGIAGPSGWFENSGELALILVIFFCFSLGYLLSQNIRKKIYFLAPITAAMTIIAASSRGSQLALVVVLILAAVFLWKVTFKNLLILAIFCWLAYLFFPPEMKARFETMGNDSTSESRLMYWEKGIDMLNNNKLFGIGYNVFPEYFERYYASTVVFDKFSYHREVAHNTFVQAGSELGYLGLFIYILMLWQCYRLTREVRVVCKKNGEEGWAISYSYYVDLALIGYLIGSFFMSVLFYPYVYLFLSLNQGLLNAVKAKIAVENTKQMVLQGK